MKRSLLFLMFIVLATSCIKSKAHRNVTPWASSNIRLDEECLMINETGDLQSLFQAIHRDTREVIALLSTKAPQKKETQIQRLATRIKDSSSLVIELSKEEWNSPVLRYKIDWIFDENDFNQDTNELYLKDPEIKSVYFLGEERPDLKSFVKIDQTGNAFTIEYLNMGTLLEYCQLNRTLMIIFEVKYDGLMSVKKKVFNLYVGEK